MVGILFNFAVMKLTDIKPNPNNPRISKDANFKKLVKSIEEFPKMMALRPIVVDEDGMVLGGNMRLRALQHLKFKEIPDEWVKRAADLTEDEQRRFIIADNVSGGEWDVDDLSINWDRVELSDWGLDIPDWAAGIDANAMTDDDVDLTEEFNPIGLSAGLARLVVIFDTISSADNWIKENELNIEYKKKGNDENIILQVNLSSNYGI